MIVGVKIEVKIASIVVSSRDVRSHNALASRKVPLVKIKGVRDIVGARMELTRPGQPVPSLFMLDHWSARSAQALIA